MLFVLMSCPSSMHMYLICADFHAHIHASRGIDRLWHMCARYCRLIGDL